MNEHPITDLMGQTMARIKEIIDVDTIVGEPIVTPDGTTVIPVSKVAVGFGSGGSDFVPKNARQDAPLAFGGGGGGGVTVSPVCFVVISPIMGTQVLNVNASANSTVDRLVEMIPGAINKVASFVEGRKSKIDPDKMEDWDETDE